MTEKKFIAQPKSNNLLVRKEDLEEEKKILIPGSPEESQNTARVLAVGPGRNVGGTLIPVDVKVGELILVGGVFKEYTVGKEKFLLINENSIVAGINEDLLKTIV